MYFSRRDYYRDRDSEYELCQDFPGDEILIDGLYSMQSHFDNNGVNITIPVVRVMNTVHYLAAYMFATTCSGDQMEYEALASMSCGRDRQMAKVVMIVLAAMLKRTEGFRAQQCRNVILDNRPPDFELGVTLYDQFLRSAEKRFSEENFLIDVDALATRVQEQNEIIEQQTAEIVQLKYIINTMDKERPKTVVINYGTYNDIHDNPYSTIYTTTPSTPDTNTPEDSSVSSDCQSDKPFFCRITQAAYDKGVAPQVEANLRSACVSAPKLVKALKTNDALGYTDTKDLYSTDLYNMLDEHYHLPFKLRTFQDCRNK